MQDQTFKIVFKGKLVKDYPIERAIANFGKLFKLPEEKAKRFFDGNQRLLKKSVTMDKANQLRTVLKKAGIRVSVVANKKQLDLSNAANWKLDPPGTIILRPIAPPEVHIETGHIKISLDEKSLEKVKHNPPPEVSINHITIDDSEQPIIEEHEVEIPDFDLHEMTMDEPGVILVNAKKTDAPNIPLDALSLDEVGKTLVKPNPIPEPEIDISSISLVVEEETTNESAVSTGS